ncbi:MAG: segregation/condensation protein A [Synergistaceae bacterium]|nr:segregation/condensation protein A [Synergistaceae bacterium]
MNTQPSFRLEAFEGPLDLLLSLIEKNKINIFDIPIALILEQYNEYIESAKLRDMNVAAEFIEMSARLIQIKCRLLLPKTGGDDPREELVRDLLPPEWHEIARRLPVIPYVRESRRILGEITLTSSMLLMNSLSYRDGKTGFEFPDAIAIGRYNIDLHNSGERADIENSLGETVASIETNRPRGNFQVPLYALVPAEVDGFIAAEKNLSMSRLAAGALRLQPICMMTGQAAGALAALAARENIPPRSVRAIKVQWELLNAGVNISLAKFRDVPQEHKYNAAVQIAMLHKLLDPLSYPHNPSFNKSDSDNKTLGIPMIKGPPLGTFGIDRQITENDRTKLLGNAPRGFLLSLPEKITRGEALDMLVRAMITF